MPVHLLRREGRCPTVGIGTPRVWPYMVWGDCNLRSFVGRKTYMRATPSREPCVGQHPRGRARARRRATGARARAWAAAPPARGFERAARTAERRGRRLASIGHRRATGGARCVSPTQLAGGRCGCAREGVTRRRERGVGSAPSSSTELCLGLHISFNSFGTFFVVVCESRLTK